MPARFTMPASQGAAAPSRRALLAAFAAAPVLARCSSDTGSEPDQLRSILGQSPSLFSDHAVTLKEVKDTPFASLGVRVGGGPQTMLILASSSGASSVWTSASHIALEMASGRIMRTAGLPQNLSNTTFQAPDPLATGLARLTGPTSDPHVVDFADRNAFAVTIDSVLAPAGQEDVDVLGTHIPCLHAIERCSAPALTWNFTNQYWASAKSGLVWRSLQTIHPDLPPLEIVLFRPPK